jgi:hypothetical protein
VTIWDDDYPRVGASVVDAYSVEGTIDRAVFRLSRTGATTLALPVSYTMSGTASNGVDYALMSGVATIRAGASYVDLTVTNLEDNLVEGEESLVLTLVEVAGYRVFATAGVGARLLDNDVPILGVSVSDGLAIEATADEARFTITRTLGDVTSPVVVRYAMSGSASNGLDYVALTGAVAFAAGSNATAVAVTPLDDALIEGPELAVLSLVAGPGYQLGPTTNATVTLYDDETSIITVGVADATASESGSDTGAFMICRTGGSVRPVTVKYALSGSAVKGVDYGAPSGVVVMAAGVTNVAVVIAPVNDVLVEGKETVSISIVADAAYQINTPSSAGLVVYDDEKPEVALAVADATAAEGGVDAGVFTVTRYCAGASPLAVKYTVSGTASNGVDYARLSGVVTIAANEAAATVTVEPVADGVAELTETVKLSLVADAAYVMALPNSGMVYIMSNTAAAAAAPAMAAASEVVVAKAVEQPVNRSGKAGRVMYAPVAMAGVDPVAGSITNEYYFWATESYAVRGKVVGYEWWISGERVSTNADMLHMFTTGGVYTVTLRVFDAAGVAGVDSVEVRVSEPVLPVVAALVWDGVAGEPGMKGGAARIRVSRCGDLTTAVDVRYTMSGPAVNGVDYRELGGVVTLAAGEVWRSVVVEPLGDAEVEGSERVVLTLDA